MNKIVVFVLGPDRPGIIANISKVLCEEHCNLEDISQTILQGMFNSIFIVSIPDTASESDLLQKLRNRLSPDGLFVHTSNVKDSDSVATIQPESFVITTVGPDRPGLIAGITEILAAYGININNLKAVARTDRMPPHYITIYEVDIPGAADFRGFRTALAERAALLGLDVNLQHRDIFEQIHRV